MRFLIRIVSLFDETTVFGFHFKGFYYFFYFNSLFYGYLISNRTYIYKNIWEINIIA